MKILLRSLLSIILLSGLFSATAQSGTTTIIVLRHAEKDTSKAGSQSMQADPPLSEKGMKRAKSLVNVLSDYRVDEIYSTDYTRTKATVTPLAERYGYEIFTYNPANQQSFADQLKILDGKTIVVVGHSNTVPKLVNMIASTEYPDMPDNVYDRLYIIKIKDGIATVEIRKY
jgi:2,3-bisphosphoglycerate-dependent phosphoglycerate mutase